MTGESAAAADSPGIEAASEGPGGAAAESMVDRVFFTFSGLSSIWFAVVLFQASFGWRHVWFFLIFWAALAYLVLPRLHRILTRIYLPDYFIGRSRTSDGLLGDPVNVAFRGSGPQLHAAMDRANWTLADPVTLNSSWRIVVSTLTRRSYDEAPVSPLFLFGRQQDFAYQQEVDGNPGKRHHIRFWQTPQDWLLPGGIPVDWLAAGTYDKAVGLSLFTLQITHKIEADIDVERDYVVASVTDSAPESTVSFIRDFSTGYHSRNGGGDSISTDGDLPIVDVTAHPDSDTADLPIADLARKRPLPTLFGAVLVLGRGVTSAVLALTFLNAATDESALTLLFGDPADDLDLQSIVVPGSIALALFALAEFVLAWFIFRGGNRARVIAMTFGALSIIVQFVGTITGGEPISLATTLVSFSLDILLILALSSERSRDFARRRSGSLRNPVPRAARLSR
ncbi:hypothetical protein PSET11_01024 [Arthrobacter ulcerisalmonis]|uniref:LssY-like C-terminal domain-containing protein n=1 Tax=Arthrobacter ulcerisalmonis TaxID=2483813 RepID=A0A3P5WM37_9MICC|nr:hypothetical protein PSET11_01024 [Arthrobacter ulcerisalmonis]